MIKVSIIRNNVVTNVGTFPSQLEADQWLANHESMGTFGTKAQTIQQQVEVQPAVVDENGTEISPALFETQEVQIPGYEVVIEDLAAQLEQERVNAEALKFLADTDYKVTKYRDQVEMGRTPDLTVEEFQYLLEQRQQARDAIK